MTRFRLWLVAVACALLTFSTPLIVISAFEQPDPELRVMWTGDAFSALLVTDSTRVLIVNSTSRGDTRSMTGHIARPWEADATTLIAPADDRAAVGLWEAMRHPAIKQVIVVGLPGREAVWSEIEKESRLRDIELSYVSSASTVELDDLSVVIEPEVLAIDVRRGHSFVRLHLGTTRAQHQAHVSIVNTTPTATSTDAGVVILPSHRVDGIERSLVSVAAREVVNLVLEPDAIRIRGGLYLHPELDP